MERYSEYKDSGVKWLGEIPSHWEVMSIKYTGIFENGLTYSPADTAKEGTLVLRSSNIQDFHLSFKDNVFVKKVSSKLLVRKGDIIICSRNGSASLVGKCALVESDIEASFGAFMMRYRPVINPKYAYYLFQGSIGYYKGLFSTTTINQLTKSVLNDIKVAIPNLEEQVVVGSYLDAATSKIDKAIAMQQKMIDLLNERKQIIIQNAVTKGLDENVEMKDSGVEWIGMIPKHWEIKRLKYVMHSYGRIGFRGYGTDDIVDEGQGAITLSPSNIQDSSMDYSKKTFLSWKKYYESPEIMIKNGDVLMVKTGSSYGKCAVVKNLPMESTINPQLVVFKEHKEFSEFLAYSFQTTFAKCFINTSVIGGTIPTISQEKINNYIFPFPSKSEQQAIVAYLDKEMQRFDSAITNCLRQIALLQERKQIIINEVVTGKVKVS